MRLGYSNVLRYPAGYIAWKEHSLDLQAYQDRSQRLQPGQFLPPCLLTAADRQRDFAYLGIVQESASFFLSDVRAEFILLTFYSEHCSQCVQEVPLYNRLFAMIQNDPDLGSRAKMIGIGVGDNQRSVLRFGRAHDVAYPLIADERRTMFDSVGGEDIPLLYLVRIQPDFRVKVLFFQKGHMESLDALFAQIKRTAGTNE